MPNIIITSEQCLFPIFPPIGVPRRSLSARRPSCHPVLRPCVARSRADCRTAVLFLRPCAARFPAGCRTAVLFLRPCLAHSRAGCSTAVLFLRPCVARFLAGCRTAVLFLRPCLAHSRAGCSTAVLFLRPCSARSPAGCSTAVLFLRPCVARSRVGCSTAVLFLGPRVPRRSPPVRRPSRHPILRVVVSSTRLVADTLAGATARRSGDEVKKRDEPVHAHRYELDDGGEGEEKGAETICKSIADNQRRTNNAL